MRARAIPLFALVLGTLASGPVLPQRFAPSLVPAAPTRTHRLRAANRQPTAIPLPVPRPRFAGDGIAAPAPPAIAAAVGPAPASTPGTTPAAPAGVPATVPATAPAGPHTMAPAVAPAVAPSGATTAFTPRQPPSDEACPGRLAANRVKAEPFAIGPQPDARCTVVQPVRLAELTTLEGTVVAFPDHPVIACATADTFAAFVRELLVPLARGTYGAPADAVWTGPGLECRSRDHIFGAKLSAHGQGLAIDIAQLKLADGRRIAVGEPRTATDQAFETAARAAACGYFHTVLGPGSDSYHRTHWHFDLEERGAKGDSKFCK